METWENVFDEMGAPSTNQINLSKIYENCVLFSESNVGNSKSNLTRKCNEIINLKKTFIFLYPLKKEKPYTKLISF